MNEEREKVVARVANSSNGVTVRTASVVAVRYPNRS